MAWLSSTAWSTSSTPVLATVLNNIGLDIRTAGGNHDMAGYSIVNCASISGPTSGRVGFGVSSGLVARVEIQESTDVPVFRAYQSRNAGGSSVLAEVQDDRGYSGANNGDSLRVSAWTFSGSTGNLLNIRTITGGVPTTRLAVKLSGVVNISNLPAYANNAAAITGGLVAGDLYSVTSSNPRQVAVVY